MMRSRIEVQNGNDELTFDGGMVTVGGRTGVDVVLRDPMVADRQCVITCEDGFVLRDTGSVTGTWVDGERAAPSASLRDGSTIVIGTTRIAVEVGDDDGIATCKLITDPQSFWWKKPGKGAFDNDADQLVYSETRFGRFPALQLSNRVAMIFGAVVLVAATFVGAVMGPLADPGPLQPSHALIASSSVDDPAIHAGIQKCVELSGQLGCNVCHTAGSGAPESKCRQCHGLPGEMGAPGTFRHPYHAGSVADQQLCVRCHTDHNGSADRKPGTDDLRGKCVLCHDKGDGNFNREALIQRAPLVVPPQQPLAFEALRFPHEQHVGGEFGCKVCHAIDAAVASDRKRGVPDDPMRHDYATVPYAVCASCHVPDADPVQMSADEQSRWRAKDHQWPVAWHGSKADEGQRCMQCHTYGAVEENGQSLTVYGPDMKTVERGQFSADLYRNERALYTTEQRTHQQQFADHAAGKACTVCHLDGKVAGEGDAPRARQFWHGLHVVAGSLAPAEGQEAATSMDTQQGCVSCHNNLDSEDAKHLTPLSAGTYHWPDDSGAQAACSTCHEENQAPLRLTTASTNASASSRAVPDFPHGAHVGSSAFGVSGSLQKGCFACHTFSTAVEGQPFTQVPQTLAGASNCSNCHQGHDDIAGGSCQQCHPKIEGQSNSFLAQARVTTPAWPTRPWPAPNGFSHLSAGHLDQDCSECHRGDAMTKSTTLANLRAPDETTSSCRACHLKEQFHWR